MSEVTKSDRAVPKCKRCGQPRKGHAGPTGLTKCKNIVDDISKMSLAELQESEKIPINCDPEVSEENEDKVLEDVSSSSEDSPDSLSVPSCISQVNSAVLGEASSGAEKGDQEKVLLPGKKTDGNLDSARAVPKCKVCGEPRKGHTGPTGLGKCKNIQRQNQDELDNTNKLTADPQESRKMKKTVGDISDYLDPRSSQVRIRLDSLSIANSTVNDVVSLVVGVAEKTPGSEAETEKTPDKLRISSVCDYENFLSESAMEDIEEVLRPEKKLDSKAASGERLGSLSEDLDIRNVLRDKTFLLCECEKMSLDECGCKGIMDFNGEMVPTLVDVFDSAENVIIKKSSWKKKSPNEMSFGVEFMPRSAAKSSVKGTVDLKAWRLVTLVKGKKHLSIDITADIEVKKAKFKKTFQVIEQEVMEEEVDSPVEEDEEDASSEDEVPSEDSDSEVFEDNADNVTGGDI